MTKHSLWKNIIVITYGIKV